MTFLNLDSVNVLEDWAHDTTYAQRKGWSTLAKRKVVFMTDSCSPDGRELERVKKLQVFLMKVELNN